MVNFIIIKLTTMIMRNLYSIIFFLLLSLTTSFAATPWLHVEGNKIKDPAGNVVILRGIDIQDIGGQKTDPTVGLYGLINLLTNQNDPASTSPGWYPHVIRFTINPGISNFQTYYDNTLKPAVDSASKKGLYVIIDNHFIADILGNIDYTNRFWSFMAPRFRDQSNVIFEVYNEPINSSLTWGQFKPYMQDWVDLIRGYAPNNLILAGSPQWDQKMGDASTNPLVGANIVYVAHVYPNHWKSAWNRTQVEMASAIVPVILTEWGFRAGASSTSLQGTVDVYGTQIMDWADLHGLSWTAWCADNDWEPTMFTATWQLRVGNNEMGGFVKDKLYEKRNDDQPADIACLAPYLGKEQTLCAKTSIDIQTGFDNTGKVFRWYKDNTLIGGETAPTLTVNQKGLYKVEVDSNGCTMSHQVSIVDTLFPINLTKSAVLTDSLLLEAGLPTDPYTYSWEKNGNVIASATSYSLKVFDTCGTKFTVTSSYAGCGSTAADFTALCPRAYYLGTPIVVPGKVEAEYYDIQNLPNLTCYDTDAGNNGGALRSDNVDVEVTSDIGGGYNVGWTNTGEWLEYSIDVQDPGLCAILFRVASKATTSAGSIDISLNGVDATGNVAMPLTGGWQTYTTVVVNNINFSATDTLLRISIPQGGFNINYLQVVKGFVQGTEDASNKTSFNIYPNPTNGMITLTGSSFIYNWQLISSLGVLIMEGSEQRVDLSQVPSGQYTLLINGEARKVVKW